MTLTAAQRPAVTNSMVDLRTPADPAYLAVIRTATAGLAAQMDFTLDDIEDLRIAVDEACVVLLQGHVHPDEELHVAFTIAQGLEVLITGPRIQSFDRKSMAWSILQALVAQIDCGHDSCGSWIRLIHTPHG